MEPWYTKIARGISRVVLIRIIILGAVAIFGYFQVADSEKDESTRDASGEVVESGDVGVYVLQIGDCLLYPSSVDISGGELPDQLKAVPCTELHNLEVISSHTLADGPYPSDAKLLELEQTFCWDDYDSYTKTKLASPPHLVQLIYPVETSWANGDREITCTFGMPNNEKLGASIRG